MEIHDHQSPVDAAMPHETLAAPTENMTARAPGTGSVPPEPAAQAMPGQAPGGQPQASTADAGQAPSVDPSAQTATPEQPGQTVSQSPQAQAAGQQAQFQPNVIMDPATGQLYYAMPLGQPAQPPPRNGQYVYYTAQAPPEQAPHQPDYAQIIKSVENFAEGDASVADVVKTLWTETSQDDQFWKGAAVGAAATVLLTSETVRGAMGKTFGSLFGKNAAGAAAPSTPAPDVDPNTK